MTGRAPVRATAPAARRAPAGNDPRRDASRPGAVDRDGPLRDGTSRAASGRDGRPRARAPRDTERSVDAARPVQQRAARGATAGLPPVPGAAAVHDEPVRPAQRGTTPGAGERRRRGVAAPAVEPATARAATTPRGTGARAGAARASAPRTSTGRATPLAASRTTSAPRTARPDDPAPRTSVPRTAGRATTPGVAPLRAPAPRASSSTRTPPAGERVLRPGPAGRTTVRRGLVPSEGVRVPARRVPPPPAPPREPADPHRRQAVLTVLVLVLLTVFAGRLVYIQGFQGEAIAAKALEERLSYAELIAARGQIMDANGKPLATSVERYTMHVNQRELAEWELKGSDPLVAGPAGAAARIAPILGMNPAELGAVLTGDAKYKVVQRDVLPAQVRAIRDLKIYSIGFDPTPKRVYPNGIVAGNLLGWVNREGQGASGLEALLDDRLAGTPGLAVWERGRLGQEIPGGFQDGTSPQAGDSVQLTLLNDLQFYAQEAIDARVAETGASSGVIVVLDPRTGELLALADSGAVDPNQPAAGNLRGSSAISDVFEPGSTAKVVTMAAALELGLTTPTTPYEVPYQYTTANEQTFKDSHEHAGLKLTTTGVLAESSNTGTVMIGQDIPQQVRHDYLAKFGFGSQLGIELPNESRGLLHPAEDWDGRTKYAVLFGQGVSVTALQATSVFATIANDGVRVEPHLIKGWTSADGTPAAAEPPTSTQVVSPQTADTVLTMLESAVDEGTGGNAAIPGYRVAGKTGTAQKFNPNGITASFIGVAPADDPRVAVGVFLQDPRSSEWGGTVAAPVFSDVAGFALQELGVAPSGVPAELFPTTWE